MCINNLFFKRAVQNIKRPKAIYLHYWPRKIHTAQLNWWELCRIEFHCSSNFPIKWRFSSIQLGFSDLWWWWWWWQWVRCNSSNSTHLHRPLLLLFPPSSVTTIRRRPLFLPCSSITTALPSGGGGRRLRGDPCSWARKKLNCVFHPTNKKTQAPRTSNTLARFKELPLLPLTNLAFYYCSFLIFCLFAESIEEFSA